MGLQTDEIRGTTGEIVETLGDAAGVKKKVLKDANGDTVLFFDSLGRFVLNPDLPGALLKSTTSGKLVIRLTADVARGGLQCSSIEANNSVFAPNYWGVTSSDLRNYLWNGRLFTVERQSGVSKLLDVTYAGALRQFSPTYGGTFQLLKREAVATLSGATTTIQVNIPDGVVVLGVAFVVKTVITGSGGLTDWSAAFTGGATDTIVSAQALAKNTKAKKAFVGVETTGETDIEISANGSETFSGGEIVAVCLTRQVTDLDSFA